MRRESTSHVNVLVCCSHHRDVVPHVHGVDPARLSASSSSSSSSSSCQTFPAGSRSQLEFRCQESWRASI